MGIERRRLENRINPLARIQNPNEIIPRLNNDEVEIINQRAFQILDTSNLRRVNLATDQDSLAGRARFVPEFEASSFN